MNTGLIASFVIAVAFDILFPLLIAFLIWRRYGVSWKIFLYGAIVFLVTQMLLRIPLVQGAQYLWGVELQNNPFLLYAWLVVLALTAGIFEEGGRYLGYRYLIKKDFTWEKSLMYGAGHGGLESMLLVGGMALLSLINIVALSTTDFSQMNLSPEQLTQIGEARKQIAAMDWWMPLLGAYERFVTLFFQIAMSVLVLQVFVWRSLRWLWIAIGLHALLDLGAVLLVRAIGPVWTEAALTITLPLSFVIIAYFRPRKNDSDVAPAANSLA